MMIGLISCDKETSEPNGYQDDTIKLSTKELSFSLQPSTKEVTTEGEQWVINELEVDGQMYALLHAVDYDDLLIERKEINNFATPFKIKGDWFTITRELKKISVELKANDSNKKRVVKIGVSDKNYFDRIEVEQAGY